MEGNLRLQVDWASVIVEVNLLFLCCFTLYLRAIFQVHYIWRQFNQWFFCVTGLGG